MFQLKQRNLSFFCHFCSIQTLKGLDDTHLHWWGLSSFLIKMLTSCRNDLTGTFRNNVLPAIWASLRPVKLTHKINHHSSLDYIKSMKWRGYGWRISNLNIKSITFDSESLNSISFTANMKRWEKPEFGSQRCHPGASWIQGWITYLN